ncbi:unnamed protein product [Microthlaspi erraticum]|uniref:CRC domain-containing protein n=1 Tax=Microthlaspi erraticum TaxID=1685480 RepID=A0A6D2ICJ3_9BRAS|nr:unnamed protein product [Microthlaspi erraticum]
MEKLDQDSGSNQNLLPRQLDFSPPAAAVEETKKMDSFHETEKKQSHSVLDSQSSREDQKSEQPLPQPQPLPSVPDTEAEQLRLGVKSLKPPPSSPVKSPQQSATEVTPPQKPPLHRFSHQVQKNPLVKCRVSKQDPLTQLESSKDDTPNKQKHCNCKASKCLKLYCECFASGSYCNGCNCLNCHNNLEHESSRQEAITTLLERNPDAFKPKIAGSPHGMNDLQEDVRQSLILGKHSKGCHCKKSGCLKKYCECYQADILCSENCKCQDCKNFEGSKERNPHLLHGPQVSETYVQQSSAHAAVNRAIDGYLEPSDSRKRKIKDASHSVPARVPHIVQNQTVNHVIRNGDTSLFLIPKDLNNKAVSGSTTFTYRSSLSNTIQPRHVNELCLLLVSKSVDVAKKLSGGKCETEKRNDRDSSVDTAQRDANEMNDSPDCVLDANRMDEKPLSPATRALMCDEEQMIISEKETSAQGKEDADTSSEVYLEQERQILSSFRDYLIQLSNRVSINGANIKTKTNPSKRELEDEEQSHRDSSLG